MKDKDSWERTYDEILTSFAFIAPTESKPQQPASSTSSGSSGSSDIIFEGEEIIE